MTAVDPGAGFDFLVAARQAETDRFTQLVNQKLQDAQGFTDLVNKRLADDAATAGAATTPAPNPRPGTTSPPTSTTLTPEEQSAKGILDTFFANLGLGALADWAWQKHLQGESDAQIFLEARGTDEYKARFPAMAALAKNGHAITEGQYMDLERQYTQAARQYGLPSGFYDQPSDFTALISGEVSPAEFSSRLQDYQSMVFDTDPTARSEMQRLYGITSGDLAAYFIDPDKSLPFLQQRFGATQSAAAAQRSGFGPLSQTEAEYLANISPDQAAQGFGNLVGLNEIPLQLPGEQTGGISREDLIGAQFKGNANAQRRIQQAAQRRVAEFAGGGGFEQSQQGISGVG